MSTLLCSQRRGPCRTFRTTRFVKLKLIANVSSTFLAVTVRVSRASCCDDFQLENVSSTYGVTWFSTFALWAGVMERRTAYVAIDTTSYGRFGLLQYVALRV